MCVGVILHCCVVDEGMRATLLVVIVVTGTGGIIKWETDKYCWWCHLENDNGEVIGKGS